MAKIILKRKIAPRIAQGHPWIFANEVDKLPEGIQGGIFQMQMDPTEPFPRAVGNRRFRDAESPMPGQRGTGGVMSGTQQNLTLEDAEALLKEVKQIKAITPVVGGSAQLKYFGKN